MARAFNVPDLIRKGRGRYPVPGAGSLYLTVRGGSARWEYQFRQNKSLQSLWLGSAIGPNAVSVTAAKEARAAAWLTRRAARLGRRSGTLPVRQDAPRRAADDSLVRYFGEAVRTYLDDHAPEWTAKTLARHRFLVATHCKPLDARPVNLISVGEVASALKSVWTGPGSNSGGKLRGLLEKVFDAEGVDPNPAAWAMLRSKLHGKAAEETPQPSLPYDQVPALMAKLALDESRQARALRFLILTSVRRQEAVGADWSEFDLAAKLWTIPAHRMKGGKREHIVPLSDAAIAALGKPGTGLVFGKMGHDALRQLLGPFKLTDERGAPVTVHGFRATFGTWAQEQKPPYRTEAIDAAHAHLLKGDKASKVTSKYQRSPLIEERRPMMGAWAAFATTGA